MNIIYKDFTPYTAPNKLSVNDYLKKLDTYGAGFLIIRNGNEVIGILTDGDVRRYLLKNNDMNSIINIEGKKFIKADVNTNFRDIQMLWADKKLDVLPLVHSNGSLACILTHNEVESDITGFILAGGEGTRLRPLTLKTPKPLLKIGGQTLLDRAVNSITEAGANRIEISINYLSEQFYKYVEANYFDKDINLIREKQKYGTAGSIRLSSNVEKDFLICNADLITDFKFIQLILSAISNDFDMVVATRVYSEKVAFGVVETVGQAVTGINEKPIIKFNVAAGVYFIKNHLRELIPEDKFYDMPTLIQNSIENNYKVGIVNITGSWVDVGRIEQFDEMVKQYG